MNYQIQGSGADLLLLAMANLAEPAKGCLIIEVHDELLFEASANQAELVMKQAELTMQEAWAEMLGRYDNMPVEVESANMPVEVESALGASWSHRQGMATLVQHSSAPGFFDNQGKAIL